MARVWHELFTLSRVSCIAFSMCTFFILFMIGFVSPIFLRLMRVGIFGVCCTIVHALELKILGIQICNLLIVMLSFFYDLMFRILTDSVYGS